MRNVLAHHGLRRSINDGLINRARGRLVAAGNNNGQLHQRVSLVIQQAQLQLRTSKQRM